MHVAIPGCHDKVSGIVWDCWRDEAFIRLCSFGWLYDLRRDGVEKLTLACKQRGICAYNHYMVEKDGARKNDRMV